MSTRATYAMNGLTFYCHDHGSPTSAAGRFVGMIEQMTVPSDPERRPVDAMEDRRGGAAFAFIRANLDAEQTESHDAHGDTEYQYDLVEERYGALKITVRERTSDGEVYQKVYCGDLAEWIDKQRVVLQARMTMLKHRDPKGYEGIDPKRFALESIPNVVRCVVEKYHDGKESLRYATLAHAHEIDKRETAIAAWFADGNPNKPIHEKRAAAWKAAIVETK